MRTIASISPFSSRRAARRTRSSHGVPSSNLAAFRRTRGNATNRLIGRHRRASYVARLTHLSQIGSLFEKKCRPIAVFVAFPRFGLERPRALARAFLRPCRLCSRPAYASRQALRLCPFAASLASPSHSFPLYTSLPLLHCALLSPSPLSSSPCRFRTLVSPRSPTASPRRPVLGSSSPFASSCRFVDVSCRQITCSRCGLCGVSPIMQHLIFD